MFQQNVNPYNNNFQNFQKIPSFVETGTRWKDYILVTLLLSAIIGCWYAYQQNKNAKRHLRRMAQDMEGLQRAEQSLQEMQKVLSLFDIILKFLFI